MRHLEVAMVSFKVPEHPSARNVLMRGEEPTEDQLAAMERYSRELKDAKNKEDLI